jgi:serine phosphatase RsbU (regulator of sigma subunit)
MDSMQAALVPTIPSRVGDLKVTAAYQPADGPAAGGDFYDAFALDDGRVAIILGDVSGHGRAALAHAVRMRYTLRAYVEAGLNPRTALRLAGSVLGPAQDDLFTTVAIAIYDKHAASLTYATAGHPSPLTLGSLACEPVTVCASPALGWAVPTGRRQTTIPFSQGMSACFFSDGLTEAHTDDGLLGRARLARILTALGRSATASTLISGVRDDAQEIRDDMAACIIEATTGRTISDVSIEELEVAPGQLAAGQGQRFLEACGVKSGKIPPLAAQAERIAREHGVALIRVTAGRRTVTATVLPPPTSGPSTSQDAQHRASDHLSAEAPTPTPSAPPAAVLAAGA